MAQFPRPQGYPDPQFYNPNRPEPMPERAVSELYAPGEYSSALSFAQSTLAQQDKRPNPIEEELKTVRQRRTSIERVIAGDKAREEQWLGSVGAGILNFEGKPTFREDPLSGEIRDHGDSTIDMEISSLRRQAEKRQGMPWSREYSPEALQAQKQLPELEAKAKALKESYQRMMEERKRHEDIRQQLTMAEGDLQRRLLGLDTHREGVPQQIPADQPPAKPGRFEGPDFEAALQRLDTNRTPQPVGYEQETVIEPGERTTPLAEGMHREVEGTGSGAAKVVDRPSKLLSKARELTEKAAESGKPQVQKMAEQAIQKAIDESPTMMPPSLVENIQHIGGQVARGGLEMLATAPSIITATWETLLEKIIWGAGLVGMDKEKMDRKLKDWGVRAEDPEAYMLRQVGIEMEKIPGEWFPGHEGLEESFWRTEVARGVGTMLGFIALSYLTRGRGMAGPAKKLFVDAMKQFLKNPVTYIAGGMQGARGFHEALEHGADANTAANSYIMNFPGGMLQVANIFRMTSRFDKLTQGKLSQSLARSAGEIVVSGANEWVVEAGGEAWFNVSAIALYDENRDWYQNVIENGNVGGASGFISALLMEGVAGAISKRSMTRRGISPQEKQFLGGVKVMNEIGADAFENLSPEERKSLVDQAGEEAERDVKQGLDPLRKVRERIEADLIEQDAANRRGDDESGPDLSLVAYEFNAIDESNPETPTTVSVIARTLQEALSQARGRGLIPDPLTVHQRDLTDEERKQIESDRVDPSQEEAGESGQTEPGTGEEAGSGASQAGTGQEGSEVSGDGSGVRVETQESAQDAATSVGARKKILSESVDEYAARQGAKSDAAMDSARRIHRKAVLDAVAKGEAVSESALASHPDVAHTKKIRDALDTSEDTTRVIGDMLGIVQRVRGESFSNVILEVVEASQMPEGYRDRGAVVVPSPDGTTRFFINKDSKDAEGDAVANLIGHESGHLVGTMMDSFIREEWGKLTKEQRRKAATDYDDGFAELSDQDILSSYAARQEWFAFQWHRLATGQVDQAQLLSEGYSKSFVSRLAKMVEEFRKAIKSWIGDESLSTPELNRRITEILGEYSPIVADAEVQQWRGRQETKAKEDTPPTRAMPPFVGNLNAGDTYFNSDVIGNFNRKAEAETVAQKEGGRVEGYVEGMYKRGWVVLKDRDTKPAVQGKPPPKAPAQTTKAGTLIGVNQRGNPIYEDEKGVRSYLESGIFITESVQFVPGKGVVVNKDRRGRDYKTVEESATQAEPETPPSRESATDVHLTDAEKELGDALKGLFSPQRTSILNELDALSGDVVPSSLKYRNEKARTEKLQELAEHRQIRYQSVVSPRPAVSEIEARTGTKVQFYRSSEGVVEDGFVAPNIAPGIVFVNADSDAPLAWIISHELSHVAQRSPGSGFDRLEATIANILTPQEAERVRSIIYTSQAYTAESVATEITPYIVGDVLGGLDVVAVRDLPSFPEIESAVRDYFGQIPKLNPQAIEGAPDAELATRRAGDVVQKGIPTAQLPALLPIVEKLIAEGKSTPADVVAMLDRIAEAQGRPKAARVLSDAVYSIFRMVDPALPQAPEWNTVFSEIDNQSSVADTADSEDATDIQGLAQGEVRRPALAGDGRAPSADDVGVLEGAQTQDVQGTPVDRGSKDVGAISGESTDGTDGQNDRPRVSPDRREGAESAGLVSDGAGERGRPADETGRVERAIDERDSTLVEPSVKAKADGDKQARSSNYHISDPEKLVGGGPKTRFAKNRKAIETYQAVLEENRQPTAEEKDALAAYIGWGSFGQELFNGTWERPAPKQGWESEDAWLREHLGRDQWESAQRSIINAHYTDPITVGAMWAMVRAMGFKGGRVLEPSLGIGNFFGMMPQDLAHKSELTGIELDSLTGGMAQMLYPDANIQIKGYEKSQTPDGFYDLVIGNWPFAAQSPADRRYNKLAPTLHDYFFLKALDQTRPGGLVVGITSSGTMDKAGSATRLELSKKAELVAAYRLPSGAFEKYAGTGVVTDILIFRKKGEDSGIGEVPNWINAVNVKTPAGPEIRVNQYFVDNPSNVLGTLDYGHGTTQGRAGMIVHRPADLESRLNAIAESLPEAYIPRQKPDAKRYVVNHSEDRHNSITIGDDGNLYIVQGERMVRLEDSLSITVKSEKETQARLNQTKALVGIRKQLGQVIDYQREGHPDTEKARSKLRNLYESFFDQYGHINSSKAIKYFQQANDPSYPFLAALERNTETDRNKLPRWEPATILYRSTVRARPRAEHLSVSDAFLFQMNESLDLDMDRIAELAKTTPEKAAEELLKSGAIFKEPTGDYTPSFVYLSGNVRQKLREAIAAKEHGIEGMDKNIEALENILPETIPYFKIEAKLGNNWTDAQTYREFILELLSSPESDGKMIDISFGPQGWKVRFDGPTLNNKPEATAQWGVPDYKFNRIVQAAMNNTTIVIRKKDSDGNLYVDEDSSAKANEKVAILREEFSTWVWKNPERRVSLERSYNEVFNSTVPAIYDGSFLSLEGMALERGNSPFNLRKHQQDAIARGVISGRGIYAHEVGTGKTYTIAGIAIESRRLGRAKKPLIFAHNANSATVAREINEMYPGAKVLYIDNLSKDNKAATVARIVNDEWDAIVVPHSMIDRFALREETYKALAAEEIAELEAAAIDAAGEDGHTLEVSDMEDEKTMKKLRSPRAKELVKMRNSIIERINRMAQKSAEDAVSLEDAGIDMVIVDEAHVFKKPPIATKMRMRGLNTSPSNQSVNLMFMLNYINGINGGRGVHLFTGTPITNTLNEIYNMQRFVMGDVMKRDGVAHWDAWFNTFADQTTDVEVTPSGEFEPVTRLASFVNVPELRRMVGQYMDVVFADEMPEFSPRTTATGKTLESKDLTEAEREELVNGRSENPQGRPYKRVVNVTIPMTPDQQRIRKELAERSEVFRKATRKARRDMLLSGSPNVPIRVETDAANTGLDVRLMSESLPDDPDSKVNRAIGNVMEIYRSHPKAGQVIFMERGYSDSSVVTKTVEGEKVKQRVDRFNLAKDIVDKLERNGIPSDQIAVVDGSTPKAKRLQIADAMNRGDIRIVIGSTGTLGTGVNMQENLKAIHHLDAPWMPGELEQRNGRGHRQGNKWNTVTEYRYVTEGIDGRRWQVLVVKDKFIKNFMRSKDDERIIEGDAVSIEDSDSVGDMIGTLADAVGDPRIMQLAKLKKDVEKLLRRERLHVEGTVDAKNRAKSLLSEIEASNSILELLRADIETYDAAKGAEGDAFSISLGEKTYTDRKAASDALDALSATFPLLKYGEYHKAKPIGSYLGFNLFGFVQESSMKPVIHIRGKETHEAKDSLSSIESVLRNMKGRAERMSAQIQDKERSRANLLSSADSKFGQQDLLDRKQKLVERIEADLRINPTPPPAWLIQATPIGTSVYVDGRERLVAGHTVRKDKHYVLLESGEDVEAVGIDRVKDEQGFLVYENVPTDSGTPSKPAITLSDGPIPEIGGQQTLPMDVQRLKIPKLSRLYNLRSTLERRLHQEIANKENRERIEKYIERLDAKIAREEQHRIDQVRDSGLFSPPVKGTPEQEAIRGRVNTDLVDRRPVTQKVSDWVESMTADGRRRFIMGAVDNLAGMRFAMEDTLGKGAGDIDARLNPWKFAHATTREGRNIFEAWVKEGTYHYKDGDIDINKGSKGLAPILAQLVTRDGDLTPLWESYITAYRAQRLLKEGRERNFGFDREGYTAAIAEGREVSRDDFWSEDRAKAEIAEILKLAKEHPVLETVRKEYAEWNKALLDFAEASGVIDPASRATWEQQDYVPFYRVADAADMAKEIIGIRATKNPKDQAKLIRKLQGGTGKVAVLENIVQNFKVMMQESVNNATKQKIIRVLAGNPDLMEKVPYKAVPFKSSRDEVITVLAAMRFDELKAAGELPTVVRGSKKRFIDLVKAQVAVGQLEMLGMKDQSDLETQVLFWRMKRPVGPDIMTVMVDGKPTFWKIHDPMLMESIAAIGPDAYTGFVQKMLWPFAAGKRFLTEMITLEPGFILSNAIRETVFSWSTSPEIFAPGLSSAKGVAQMWNKEGLGKTLKGAGLGSGAAWGGFRNDPFMPKKARKALMHMTKRELKGFKASILNSPQKAWDTYLKLVETSEFMNRYGLAQEVIAKGGSNVEATFRAKDLTNFTSHGGSNLMRGLIYVIPFLNARGQSLYKLARSPGGLHSRKARRMLASFGIKTALLMGLTIGLLARNWDDERYWDLQDWDRDMYYHFFIGENHFRIPKPFEIGAVFSTIPERIVTWAGDKEDTKTLMGTFLRMFGNTFAFNPLPQGIKQGAEQAMNQEFFTGMPIENLGDQFQLPEDRFSQYTAETFKQIAEAMPDNAPDWMKSPKRLQSAYRGLTGTLGTYALDVTDIFVRTATDAPEQPERHWRDAPIARNVVGRFWRSPDPRSSKQVNEFYDLYFEVDRIFKRVQRAQASGDLDRASKMVEDNRDLLRLRPAINAVRSEIESLKKAEREVFNSRTLSPEQKRESINRITERRNQLAKMVVQQE